MTHKLTPLQFWLLGIPLGLSLVAAIVGTCLGHPWFIVLFLVCLYGSANVAGALLELNALKGKPTATERWIADFEARYPRKKP